MENKSLKYYFDKHGSDRATRHSYDAIYEKTFARDREINILEIGTKCGAGVNALSEYFYKSTIYGIDRGTECKHPTYITNRISVLISDEHDMIKIDKYLENVKFDIIIDDADHNPISQEKCFYNMRKYLNKGGYYFIEDIINLDKVLSMEFKSLFKIHDLRKVKGEWSDIIMEFNN